MEAQSDLRVELSATLVSVYHGQPRLYLDHPEPATLPAGPLTGEDLTLELAVRRLLGQMVEQPVGYIEQLYTFGDRDRSSPSADRPRTLSIAYLALVPTLPPERTISFYELFPWEDTRKSWTDKCQRMVDELETRCRGDEEKSWRFRVCFGLHGSPWNPERVLERYELLFGAGLVQEAGLGVESGTKLWGDHRRIAATALTRVRGKLAYRPLIFELLPENFTLTELQEAVEALSGGLLHKQNFRRMVENAGLVEPSGGYRSEGRGRPARLYRFRAEVTAERPAPGIATRSYHTPK